MSISVIIPVYNKVEYLRACFDQLARQSFQQFEVVAVDDGSTDGSGQLCDELARRDSRVRVVHTENGGVTAARRRGLAEAGGRYVVFVDADDGLPADALQTLYDEIERTGADEVIGRFRTQDGTESPTVYQGWADPTPLIRAIVTGKNRFPVLWGAIFRKELLDGTLDTPRDIIEGEDKLMQVKALMKRPRVWFTAAVVYLYQLGLPNSRRHTLERERLYDSLLRQVLAPQWSELADAYTLHQLKEYEKFVHDGCYGVRQYYREAVERPLPATVPLYDRLVWRLPPRLARPVVRLYRAIITLKQKGL